MAPYSGIKESQCGRKGNGLFPPHMLQGLFVLALQAESGSSFNPSWFGRPLWVKREID